MPDLVTFTSKLPFLDPKFGHLYYSTQGNRPADFYTPNDGSGAAITT